MGEFDRLSATETQRKAQNFFVIFVLCPELTTRVVHLPWQSATLCPICPCSRNLSCLTLCEPSKRSCIRLMTATLWVAMSWHAWMILSLAWGASPFLVSAMAVKNGHRGSALDVNMSTLGVSAHKTDCGTCDIFRRDDRALQLCCSGCCRGKCVLRQFWLSSYCRCSLCFKKDLRKVTVAMHSMDVWIHKNTMTIYNIHWTAAASHVAEACRFAELRADGIVWGSSSSNRSNSWSNTGSILHCLKICRRTWPK